MDNRKFVISQAVTVLLGELVLSALMVGIFALLGYFDLRVVYGAAAGSLIATLNHVLLMLGVLDGPLYFCRVVMYEVLSHTTGFVETILFALYGAGV